MGRDVGGENERKRAIENKGGVMNYIYLDRLFNVTHLSRSVGDVIFLASAIISVLCQVNISSRSLRGAY